MKTYSVKQIAEMLSTNPETVRRWIRDDKLKAVQVSRKDGNIIAEADLERFLKSAPKYFSKFTTNAGIAVVPPLVEISAIAGGIVANALLGYFKGKRSFDTRIRLDDFKNYLKNCRNKLDENIQKKQALICQTETEITEMSLQIEQYTYLLEHEDLLLGTIKNATAKMED